MKCTANMLCSLVLAAVHASAAVTHANSGGRSGSPVEKVVTLLKDLHEKISKDGEQEQKVYDKFACWCEKTSNRKADSINDARAALRALGQGVLKAKGEVAVLEAEMGQLSKEMKANLEEQAEATAIRQKQNEAFTAETTEMKEALAALEKAVEVLVKGSGAFLEQQGGDASALRAAAIASVKNVVEALPQNQALPKHVTALSEFMAGGKYAPQSMTVQGILKDMYETFSADLESSTSQEAKANKEFEGLIAAKTAAYQAMKSSHEKKAGEKAMAEELLADTSQSFDDTTNQMKADTEFFDTTKASCESKSSEWNVRSKLRHEEMQGIDKALEILTSDSARELFASSIKAGKETGASDKYDTGRDISFLQLAGVSSDAATAHERAYGALKAVSSEMHSLRLGMLAVRLRESDVGHFDKVVEAIIGMMETLKEEGASDIVKRDQCIDEYKNIDSVVANVTWLIEKNVAKIEKLENLISKKKKEKAQTIVDIDDVEAQMKSMTEERTAANELFKHTKSEDQAAIDLLMEARSALSAYYKNNSVEMGTMQGSSQGLTLLQEPVFNVSEDQASDATFSDKGKRKNEAKGILQIMTMLIEDANDEIKNGMKSEEESQLAYEASMKAAEKLKSDLETKLTNLEEMIANKQEEKSDESENKKENEGDLADEQKYKATIKPDCDWIMGAFEKRAGRREAEMAGLTKAKEFLAGYKPPALLEQKPAFDDKALSRVRFLGLGS